jgi:two-component system response regulator YesN
VFLVEIDRYNNRHEGMLQTFKVKRLVEESLRGGSCLIFSDGLCGIAVIISGRHKQEYIVEQCEEIKTQTLENLDIKISVGIGSSHKQPSGIAESYREARAALGYRPVLGYNSVIPVKIAEPVNSVGYAYPFESERRFIDSVVMGAYENAITALNTIKDALDETMPVARIAADILHTIDRRAAERGLDIEFDRRFIAKEIRVLLSPDDAFEYLKLTARDICKLVTSVRADSHAALARRTSEYIKAHYYEQPTAAKLAVALGSTPEYIERVFEAHENMGVYEYAARIRLDEAKSLIRKSSMDDEMIAIKVGYDDVRQFRNEFREYEGMSVREFRLGLRNQRTL